VRAEGCTEGQGFLLSRPIPSGELHGFLVGASMAMQRIA
jgi:EAL domain-containing protein (putative c-di-GMP-specific phosphodiesterase class I)